MRVRAAALLLLGAGLLTGCVGSGTEPAHRPSGAGPTTPRAQERRSACIPSTTSRYAHPREDLVGRSLGDVRAAEAAAGHEIRVLGENGVCADGHDDLDRKRVNVVVRDGEVVWASAY